MHTLVTALAVVQAPEEGRSLVRTMLDAIPTDPAALFILALMAGAAVAVIYYGTKSSKEGEKKEP